MEIIKSNQNQTVRLYRLLSGSKQKRKEYGSFVLEGKRLVEDAVKNRIRLEYILMTEKMYGTADFSGADVSKGISIISESIAETISQTVTPQGIFAIAEFPEHRKFESIEKGKYIALHKIKDPGNLGTVIRTADAFAMDGIILIESCELYNPKVIRSAMGSIFRVPVIFGETEDLFSTGLKTYAAATDRNSVPLKETAFHTDCIIVIGNEAAGLDADVISRCEYKFTIPMPGGAESLNAAVSAAVSMYELTNRQA